MPIPTEMPETEPQRGCKVPNDLKKISEVYSILMKKKNQEKRKKKQEKEVTHK